ncbi:MAG: ABC transporter substrate-binding protein [Paracoccaceae bacterium]
MTYKTLRTNLHLRHLIGTALVALAPVVALAQDGSTVRIAIPAETPSMASHWGYAAKEGIILRNIHEPLVDRDPVTNELIPGLAVSWDRIAPTTWEFRLREGVTYHDGSPFNAESAAFGINWTYDPANAYTVAGFLPNREYRAEAVGEYVVHVHTGTPDPIYPARAYSVGLPSMVQLQNDRDAHEVTPVGTGPYRLAEWKRGSSYTLARNPDWWGAGDTSIAQPGFDTAIYVVRPEASSRIAGLRAGEVDFAWDLTPDECSANLGASCIAGPTPETVYVRLDVTHHSMSDPRVREAMSLAIDREAIAEELMGGAQPAAALVIPGVSGHPGGDYTPYDPERAMQLLAEAKADGVPVDSAKMFISIREGSFASNSEVMQAIHAMLATVGLPLTINTMEDLEFRSLFDLPASEKPISPDRGWVALHRHNNAEFDYARTYAANHRCSGPASTGCDEARDAVFDAAAELIGDERRDAFAQIADMMYRDPAHLMFLPVAHPSIFHGVDTGLDWQPRSDMQLLLRDLRPATQ